MAVEQSMKATRMKKRDDDKEGTELANELQEIEKAALSKFRKEDMKKNKEQEASDGISVTASAPAMVGPEGGEIGPALPAKLAASV